MAIQVHEPPTSLRANIDLGNFLVAEERPSHVLYRALGGLWKCFRPLSIFK